MADQGMGAKNMARYYHNSSYHHQRRFIARARKFIAILVLGLLLGAAVIIVDARRANRQSAAPSVPTHQESANYSPPVEVFRTPYFQFQTDKSWKAIDGETTPNKFVYRSLEGSLVQHELTIYVNGTPADLLATRVLPVVINSVGSLMASRISDHCGAALPAGNSRNPANVTIKGITFRCNPDSPTYDVVIGSAPGGTIMKLTRPGGTNANYLIFYRNLTALPDDTQIVSIVSTFQTR